jgi:hypothetical protein
VSELRPDGDGSRLEAVAAGERHEALDAAEHTVAAHPANPNDGVRRATPPDRFALTLAAVVAGLTLLALVLLAGRIG